MSSTEICLPKHIEEKILQYKEKCEASWGILSNHINLEKPIYHFTSPKGLDSILKSQYLRFTRSTCLNDKLEIQYGIRYAKKLAQNHLNDTKLVQLFDEIFKEESNKLNVYISSFSESVDNLNLWRFYTDNCHGVAIGFDRDYPRENNIINEIRNPIITKVIYGEAGLIKLIEPLFLRVKKIISSQKAEVCTYQQQNELYQKLIVILSETLIYIHGRKASII